VLINVVKAAIPDTRPREATYHGARSGESPDANRSCVADESWAGVARCIPALATKSPTDDGPMDNDDGSNFARSTDGIRSRSLADVSVTNDDSKMPAALRLVVLVIERRDDVTGRGARKAQVVVIVSTSSNAAMLEVPRMIELNIYVGMSSSSVTFR